MMLVVYVVVVHTCILFTSSLCII